MFATLLLFSSILSFNQALAIEPSFKGMPDWIPGKEVQTTLPDGGKIIGKSYLRFAQTPDATYSIGSLIYFKVPRTKENKSLTARDAIEAAKKSMNLTGASERTVGTAKVYEGYWKEARRQYKLFVTVTDEAITYSTAMYRVMYGPRVKLETEILQRTLHDTDVKKTSALWNWNIISPTHAADCSQCAGDPLCLLMCTTGNTSSAPTTSQINIPASTNGNQYTIDINTDGINKLTEQLEATNSNITNLNNALQTATNSADQYRPAIEEFNKNHAETNTTANRAIDAMTQQGNQANATANRAIDAMTQQGNQANATANRAIDVAQLESQEWRKEYSRTNDLITKMLDPKHAALLAGASAAGAVVGASAANMAIAGIKAGAAFLYKWISGELRRAKEEQLYSDFIKARKTYEETSSLAKKLEKTIDEMLLMFQTSKKFEFSNEDILKTYNSTIILENLHKKKLEEKLEELYSRNSNCASCKEKELKLLADEIAKANTNIETLKSVQTILAKGEGKEAMCRKMHDAFIALAEAEAILQEARPAVLAGEKIWNKMAKNRLDKANKNIHKIRKDRAANSVAKLQDKNRDEFDYEYQDEFAYLAESLDSDCVQKLKWVGGKRVSRAKRRAWCQTLPDQYFLQRNPAEVLREDFPGISNDQINELVSKDRLFERAKKVVQLKKDLPQINQDWKASIAEHKENSLALNGMLTLDPYIAFEQINSMNKFFERLKSEQSFLFTGELKKRKEKISDLCAGVKYGN